MSAPQTLAFEEWSARRDAHHERVQPWVAPRLKRAFRHERHPVEDFLFEYYSHRPAQLLRWHPGFGVTLSGPQATEYLTTKDYMQTESGVTVGPLPEKRREPTQWIANLLQTTSERAGFFGCFGIHEWAMVYRSPDIRYPDWPLRLSPEALATFVESQPIRCTHFDAFRFFTPEARPLNRVQPTRNSTLDFEQPACLHANMDLYKWAYKLSPWTSSELVADAFALTREIREVDMRASPYDFSALGHAPIRIETPQGRDEYECAQREFAARAIPIRNKLAALCRRLLAPAAALVFLTSCATKPLPEDATHVVALMSQRLALAHDIAWAKWADGLPVRDPSREAAVLERAGRLAEAADIEPGLAVRLMRAQIEASNLQQEFWMTSWRTGSGLPPGEPPTLASLRIRIDSISSRLVAEWAATPLLIIPKASVCARLVADGATPAAASAAAAGLTRTSGSPSPLDKSLDDDPPPDDANF